MTNLTLSTQYNKGVPHKSLRAQTHQPSTEPCGTLQLLEVLVGVTVRKLAEQLHL